MKSDFPPRGTQRIRPKFGTVRQRRRFSDLAFLPCLWTKWTLDGPTAPCVKTGMRSDARSASYGRFGNIASAEAHDGQEACVCGPNTLPEEGKTAGLADPRFPGLMANRSAALARTTTVLGMNRASFCREKDQTRGRAIRHHLWAPFAGWTLTV